MLFRRKHEKVFGNGLCIPLDRNAKVRIEVFVETWNARHKALLWVFHNSRDGRCFPGYERIAEKAKCARSTVYEALKVLELTGILTWQNRIARIRERAPDLFGRLSVRWRVIRTSNAYTFRDPRPGSSRPVSSKSENLGGTLNQEIQSSSLLSAAPIDPDSPLEQALRSFGRTIKEKSLGNESGSGMPANN